MRSIKNVTQIAMHHEDLREYQESIYRGSLGTSTQGVLETLYNIELTVDPRLPKGFIFVTDRTLAVPTYMSITEFRRTYGTI